MTADVLAPHRRRTGKPFVDVVADAAEQKGTGRWTVQSALDLGVPVTGIAEATFARSVSGHTEQREAARKVFDARPATPPTVDDRDQFVDDVRAALYASKVVAYAQGFDQIVAGSRGARLGRRPRRRAPPSGAAAASSARSSSTGSREAYEDEPDLTTLLTTEYFAEAVKDGVDGWRGSSSTAAAAGVPVPAFASSLSYFDGLRRDRLPAALIQALRDNFGAHTYQPVDREGTFHTLWAGDRSEVEG